MKLPVLISLLFFTINLRAQTDLGIGLVSINFDDKTVLHFFNSPVDSQPEKIIEFFNDTTIYNWNIRNLEKQKEWLKPEALWLDYSAFVFRCKTQKNDWFEVIVNNENGKTYWLKKSGITKFSDWEAYLKDAFSVSRLPGQKQKIREQPDENAKEIIYPGEDCFRVKSMKGDWIEITTGEFCDESDTHTKIKIRSGWIKWRQGNKLLIEYSIAS